MTVQRGHHNRLARTAALLAFAGATLAIDLPALAQQEQQRRLERAIRNAGAADDYRLRVDTRLALTERAQFDAGGSYTFTALFLDDSTGNSRRLFQHDLQVYARGSIDGVHNAFVRLRFPYRDFSPGDSFDGRGDRWPGPFLDRYVYEFDLAKAYAAYEGQTPENNLNIKVGRQFVAWAGSLALSDVLLSVRPTVTIQNVFTIEGLFGITPDTTVDFDASRSQFNTHTNRTYYGLKPTVATEDGREYYVYALKMADQNNDSLLAQPIGGVATANFDYEATYLGIGTAGALGASLLYQAEFVWERGHSMSDPLAGAQVRSIVEAYAGKALLTYLFRDRNESRAQFEALFASGDQDRRNASDTANGNQPGTRDHGYNSLGFAYTGLAFAPSLSNIVSLRLGASTFPLKNNDDFGSLQIGIDGFLFRKFSNGAINEPTRGDDTFLGSEVDLFVNYRITSDLAVSARYGAFFPGEAISSTKQTRQFLIFSATLSF